MAGGGTDLPEGQLKLGKRRVTGQVGATVAEAKQSVVQEDAA